jgi:hypothetical protein
VAVFSSEASIPNCQNTGSHNAKDIIRVKAIRTSNITDEIHFSDHLVLLTKKLASSFEKFRQTWTSRLIDPAGN